MQFVIFGFVLLICNRCFGSEENVHTAYVAYGKNSKEAPCYHSGLCHLSRLLILGRTKARMIFNFKFAQSVVLYMNYILLFCNRKV